MFFVIRFLKDSSTWRNNDVLWPYMSYVSVRPHSVTKLRWRNGEGATVRVTQKLCAEYDSCMPPTGKLASNTWHVRADVLESHLSKLGNGQWGTTRQVMMGQTTYFMLTGRVGRHEICLRKNESDDERSGTMARFLPRLIETLPMSDLRPNFPDVQNF